MANIIYPQLSYDIQGACFDTHNRVSDHAEPAAAMSTPTGLTAIDSARTEQLLQVFCLVRSELGPGLMHMHYRRACLGITSDIESRNCNYLKLLGLKQGLIVNFRTAALQAAVIAA